MYSLERNYRYIDLHTQEKGMSSYISSCIVKKNVFVIFDKGV